MVIWKTRPFALLILAVLLYFSGTIGHSDRRAVTATNANFPQASQAIAFGTVIEPNMIDTGGKEPSPAEALTDEWTPLSHVTLVNIGEGEFIQPSMVAPTLNEALVPPGRTVVAVSLINSQILEFTPIGAALDIYTAQTESSQRIIRGGEVLRILGQTINLGTNTTTEPESLSTKSSYDSATVLLAVSESEAHKLAQSSSWESAFTAVLVQ